MPQSRRVLGALAAAFVLVGAGGVGVAGLDVARAATAVDAGPTPKAKCGADSNPETGPQGRVSTADVTSGRAAKGYTCNMATISHYGRTGGFKVFRYIDTAGHECAFYDSTLLFPTAPALAPPGTLPGVFVLDMADPAHPVQTAALTTPAMLSPHESLSLNEKRGLLAADMGYPTFNPGFVDVYDVSQDCRHPVLKSSAPTGILGHEGNFSPDGNTFWVSSAGGQTLAAVDVTNPSTPLPLWTSFDYSVHGLNISDDGNRMYAADLKSSNPGLYIFDTSEVQQRKPNPKVTVVSHLTWPEVSIPQVPIPVTIGGHPYLVEIDEYSSGTTTAASAPVGAARIIDIGDEKNPKVVSNIRLEVNQPANRATDEKDDPGASFVVQGYAGHYCAVPSRVEPGVVACSFIVSGLRVFDIRDPYHPKEIAYANFPTNATKPGEPASSFAMSAPAFVPERGEVWYADGNSGFYNLHVTNGGVAPSRRRPAGASRQPPPSQARSRPPPPLPRVSPAVLAATGGSAAGGTGAAVVVLGVAFVLRRMRVRSS